MKVLVSPNRFSMEQMVDDEINRTPVHWENFYVCKFCEINSISLVLEIMTLVASALIY